MNVKTTAEILALSSTALRDYAKEIGVKRASNDTKVTLQAKVEGASHKLRQAAQAEREEIAAMKARASMKIKVETAAHAPKAKCTQQPCTRKVTDGGLCDLHREEGEWENTHNDQAHGDNEAEIIDDPACWFCHPELNKANASARKGTSKAGMKIVAKGTYIHKSQLVKATLEGMFAKVSIETTGDRTVLTATLERESGTYEIDARWIGNAWDYAGSAGINGKKVRNVKELLRKLGAKGAEIN
jgi:hypothetical protein